jgi:hypothetical protein
LTGLDGLLAAIEASWPAQYLRFSRFPYAAVNGVHVFAISLLVGSTVPLGLRLIGLWKDIPASVFQRVLSPVAACGLALAIASGLLLFSVRASEYAALGVFQLKLTLIAAGFSSAAIATLFNVFRAGASRSSRMLHGAISIMAWTGALACGRLIAFVGN